jgi:hypothetical protein
MIKTRGITSSDHFDLLPFIAILMSFLGALLLITISMTTLMLGPGAGEGWLPAKDTLKISKIPILIEWDGTTAVIHKNDKKIYASWNVSTLKLVLKGGNYCYLSDTLDLDPNLWDVIAELKKDSDHKYALFAVRPSGFSNFLNFSDEFKNRDIDIGKEPIEQDKSVRIIAPKKENGKKKL